MEKGFLQPPRSSKDWEVISKGFENRWNFPHCAGALDGKHVVIQAPGKSGSLFFNHRKSLSIVLLALCDAYYQFTAVDIGEAGRQSHGGVFANSNLGRSIVNDYFNLPQPKKLYSESEFLSRAFLYASNRFFHFLLTVSTKKNMFELSRWIHAKNW